MKNIYGEEDNMLENNKEEKLDKKFLMEEILDRQVDSENGIIFLNDEIGDCETSFLMKDVMYIRKINPNLEKLTLIIDSPGGSVYTMLGIVDYINSLDIPVDAVCRGQAMSAAAVIFSCVTGKRYISKNSVMMFHEMSLFNFGKINESKRVLDFHSKIEERVLDLLVSKSNKDLEFWKKVQEKDFYLLPEEAKELGLADEII